MKQVTTVAAPWRTLANRDEPARVPCYFKMFNTTGAHRESPGRMPRTAINQGDAVVMPAHSGNVHVSNASLP